VTGVEGVPLEVMTAPAYTADLGKLDINEVRARRDGCSEAEVGLSYVRRLVQGRLDIIDAEIHRRGTGEGAVDVASLVAQLPEILADHVHAPGYGRLPQIMAPGDIELGDTLGLDAIAPLDSMGTLADLPDDELSAMEAALVEFERDVSRRRRELHGVFDKLQEEVIRRYRSGEADVNDLLR
jgi:hypothetical protein